MKKNLLLIILLITMVFVEAQAQNRQITGTVTDKITKETVIGASILVKGTSIGTQTSVDGKFKLSVPDKANGILVIRSVGYKTQEVTLGTQTNFNISLESDSKQLDEVVAIGYANVRRSSLPGAVSSISEK